MPFCCTLHLMVKNAYTGYIMKLFGMIEWTDYIIIIDIICHHSSRCIRKCHQESAI